MRIVFILVFFLAAFILVVINLTAGVDLTPNTSGVAQAAAPSDVSIVSEPQVITIQESSATTSKTSEPVTGGCTNPYTIQSGDSLSQIAVNSNTTLVAIRQANLQITNANLIYPGQQVNIPNGNINLILVTGKEETTPVASLQLSCACNTAPIPVTGPVPMLIPGSSLQVRAINFPANIPINVAIGPKNTAYTVVKGVMDANGNLTTSITVPTVSNSETVWFVVVSTTIQPSVQAMSTAFNIDP